MAVDRDRVYQALRNLDSEKALRNLLERELGYDYEGGLISVDDLPEDVAGALDGDLKLFASTASEGRFTVIYARLGTPGKLFLVTERKIMERLRKSYPYSLYVFSDAENRLWHFVNAPLDPEAQGPGHLSGRKQYRRIVVGPGERFRTATERISLLSVDDLAENSGREPEDLAPLAVHTAHDKAFDVEVVTKEFFHEYRQVFENVEESVTGIEDEEDRRYFVQRLFNRLMFVAFIEKKGWLSLHGRTDYLSALWNAYSSAGDDGQGFYRSRLKPLFFRGFNAQEDRREDPVIGVVPYLNGGLFEEDEDDRDDRIDVPDGCLDEIINGLFTRFNFTTTESTPLFVEVAVDPEMLGKVFEELVTGRQEVGAYYTPKPVVSFMCREVLKGYLGGYEALIEEHDASGIGVPEARELLRRLAEFRVADPACGSGAYLLGMLQELHLLNGLLDTRNTGTARDDYQRKLDIIQNNIFGVDIDPFAVNIARLRLWLSLVVDYEDEYPPPLPNLDFKIEVGDSLTSPDPSGSFEPDMYRQEQVARFLELRTNYLGAHGAEKQHLWEQVAELRREITEWAHPEGATEGFDWQVEFIDVFAESGFDAVIANPPYGLGVSNQIRDLYFDSRSEGSQSKDSYGIFMARALQLLKPGGQFSFIVSDTWRTIRSHKPLRKRILEQATVAHVLDLPLWIFGATVNTCILSLAKGRSPEGHTLVAGDLRNIKQGDWETLSRNLSSVAGRGVDLHMGTGVFRVFEKKGNAIV